MTLKWNRPLTDLGANLEQMTEKKVVEGVTEVLEETTLLAEALQVETLVDAHTKYGRWRYAHGIGNGPGRDDTGNMIDSRMRRVYREGDVIIGEWGWDNPEDYFMAQEHGLENIPAANSLVASHSWAKEEVRAQLGRMGR